MNYINVSATCEDRSGYVDDYIGMNVEMNSNKKAGQIKGAVIDDEGIVTLDIRVDAKVAVEMMNDIIQGKKWHLVMGWIDSGLEYASFCHHPPTYVESNFKFFVKQ